ncbi:hypothetical protein P22_1529 [Propionispora sp. 2/2-37]|nr:hypothetical protein P22_1529 [Propionispora sp. 2/2-37]
MYSKGTYYPKYDCDDTKDDYCHHHYMKDDCYKEHPGKYHCYEPMYCDIPKMPKMEKECVKTFKCVYKLYRICQYKVFKVCPTCGHEFDSAYHHGVCPKCMMYK